MFEFRVSLAFTGYDHAGPEFELGLLGYNVQLGMYDTRHWNNETDSWEEYDTTH